MKRLAAPRPARDPACRVRRQERRTTRASETEGDDHGLRRSAETKSKADLTNLEAGKTYCDRRRDEQGQLHVRARDRRLPCTTASIVGLADKGFFDGHDVPSDRPRLRDPGRRPDWQRNRRARVYDRRMPPPPDTKYVKGLVAMAKAGERAAGHIREPVLRRHGRGRRASSRLRRPRKGHGRASTSSRRSGSSASERPDGAPTERVEIKSMKLEER